MPGGHTTNFYLDGRKLEMQNVNRIDNVVQETMGDRTFYFGTIGSDKIKSVSFVPVIEESTRTYVAEDVENGYQRPASASRMRVFAKFLEENPSSIVPPVLLSSRGNWVFEPDGSGSRSGSLLLNDKAAIIDGQHRLGGYVHLYERTGESRKIPFILLEGLDIEQEKGEFVVVNNSQKGVPRALTAFLDSEEEAQIAWQLNEDPDSVFRGRITRTSMSKSHLFALHSVARQMKVLFSLGGLQDLDMDVKIEYAQRFFQIVSDTFPTEWEDLAMLDDEESRGRRSFVYKMLELTGLIAWASVGKQILHRCYTESAGVNWEHVETLVERAGGVDWQKDGQYAGRTGTAGASVIATDMERLLGPEEAAM